MNAVELSKIVKYRFCYIVNRYIWDLAFVICSFHQTALRVGHVLERALIMRDLNN